eukprot:410450-Pyramimonas_sp.AAC.1
MDCIHPAMIPLPGGIISETKPPTSRTKGFMNQNTKVEEVERAIHLHNKLNQPVRLDSVEKNA